MRYLLPLLASSALVAAAPAVMTVYDTVTVTEVQYVDESAPTGGLAIPYFQAPAPAPTASSAPPAAPAPAPAPSSPSPAAPAPVPSSSSPAAPAVVPSSSQVAPAPAPAVASSLATSGNKDGQNTQNNQNTQGQATTQSADSVLAKMPEAQVLAMVKTCWNGQITWPVANTPGPCVDVVAPQLSIFPRPATKANTMTINNYCGYPIYYSHYDGATVLSVSTINAGSSVDQPMSGTVFKLGKTAGPNYAKDAIPSPVLIEYGVGGGNVYYDLSLINCINGGDTSTCAGHEAGLQIGGPNAKTFQCAAGAWCDDQVYMYQENLCKKQNPVSASAESNGLAVDFCASQKH